MSEPLLAYVLRRLEQFPKALFWGTDLKSRSGSEYANLSSLGLLRLARSNPPENICLCPSGPICEAEGCEVVETNGKPWAICTCPAEQPPIVITRDDLHRYALDIDAFVRLLHDANKLAGHASPLADRFIVAGESKIADRSIAWVFGLLATSQESVTLLDSLRARLPRSFSSILVLTPFYRPPLADAVRLEGQGIYVVSGATASDYRLAVETVLRPAATMGSGIPASWPDGYFQDEDSTWLTAGILTDRFGIPDSRLKAWRDNACPDLDGQKLAAKKVAGVGWVYFRMHVNQIANRRDDRGKVGDKLNIETRLEAAAKMKREQQWGGSHENSR